MVHLQVGLALCLLEDRFDLGSLHHVALDLELTTHEETLSIGVSGDELAEVIVREDEGDCDRQD